MFYKMFSDFHSYKAIITFDINIDCNEFKLQKLVNIIKLVFG